MAGSKRCLTLTIVAAAAVSAACSEATTPTQPAAATVAGAGPSGTSGMPSSPATPSALFKVPEERPGPPYFSISANGNFIPHDGAWAAFPFLRQLDCVPGGHDLLAFPAPVAFGCPLTVEGHERWQNGPAIDPAPRQTHFEGLGAVPIIFARWDEVQAALPGGLTLDELQNLPSAMIGTATFYKETNILGISGPHGPGKGMYKINARGSLPGGGSFTLHVNEVLGELRVVQIDFGS
jgi:hypothetical protein